MHQPRVEVDERDHGRVGGVCRRPGCREPSLRSRPCGLPSLAQRAARPPDDYACEWVRSRSLGLRPRQLRPLASSARHKALDTDLVRTIHEFHAILLLTGSTASANL